MLYRLAAAKCAKNSGHYRTNIYSTNRSISKAVCQRFSLKHPNILDIILHNNLSDTKEKGFTEYFHKPLIFLVRPTGIEPVAYNLGGCRSIQLSYERNPHFVVILWGHVKPRPGRAAYAGK